MSEPSFLYVETEADGIGDIGDSGANVEVEEQREKLLLLSEKGEIKLTKKVIQSLTDVKVTEIFQKYRRKQLDVANDILSTTLINRFSELMGGMGIVNSSEVMKKELADNELLKGDLKNLFGMVTPYIPLIGFLTAGVTIGKHVIQTKMSKAEEEVDQE